VVNAAMSGAIPASYTPPTLAGMLASEDGATLTVNAAPLIDGSGFPLGCIEAFVREGEARRGRSLRYIG
jgi:hypothetical protein